MPQATRRRPPPPPQEEQRPQEQEKEQEIPDVEKRERTAKFRKLETAVEGIYIMLGGGLTTLPMVAPRTKMMGMSLASSASEIAEAWIDLAEEDKRVLRVLEQFTSFSGWGKVIGVHFMAIGAGVPGIVGAQQQQRQKQQRPQQAQSSDIEQAMALADFMRQAASEARVNPQGNGAPTEQEIREAAAQAPAQEGVTQQVRRTTPTGPFRGGRGTGMPSPADLGVTIPGESEAFPTSGPESVKG
jgi:hypothetical protein